jgi:hypothetical protein
VALALRRQLAHDAARGAMHWAVLLLQFIFLFADLLGFAGVFDA